MREKLKFSRGKTPLEQMVNAEFLLAKDPDHLPYAEAMLKAAVAADYKETAKWIADLLFGANNAAQSPSIHTYLLLKDSYADIGQWDRALAACQHAVRMRPKDGDLADEFQRLTAELTVAKGKYDKAEDFRESIKDREVQERLQSQESVVKTEDYRTSAVKAAREVYALDPNSARNIFQLASALAELRTDEGENEAMQILEEAYKKKQDFSFKERAGIVQIEQLKRKIRQSRKELEEDPDDSKLKSQLAGLLSKLNKAELDHYKLCVENYPTDLRAKYEYGCRLLLNKHYDQAIPLLQEAQRDPRHKISAMNKVGLCFFMKGWYADAADVFTAALESYEIKDDDTAKELRYNLARSYEEQGNDQQALDIYRKIAQLDFGYKDVSKRVDKLRNKDNGAGSQ